MNKTFIFSFLIPFLLAILIGYIFYDKYSVTTVEYSGLGDSVLENVNVARKNIIFSDEIKNSEKIEFVQRKITGGGINPGWVISLLETQPNIFTGRVIVDDGVYQHPVTVKEEVTDIFIGEMKDVGGRKDLFSMKKNNIECSDEEGNIFEYTLSGTYGATQFSGCGGEVRKVVEVK